MARRERSYYDHSRKPSVNRLRKHYSFLDIIMFLVSGLIAVALLISWSAGLIDPASNGMIAPAVLFIPMLFLANFLCLLYWIIRWRRGVIIPLVIFVLGVWSIPAFFRPRWTENYHDYSRDRSLLNVMTYNVRGMMHEVDHSSGNSVSSMDDIIAVIDSLDPGILCIQEFQTTKNYTRSNFEEALSQYSYKRIQYILKWGEDLGWGVAIYSKHPIAESGHINFSGTSNSLIWADAVYNRDTIRIFNAHLQTTSITASDQDYIVNLEFVGDSVRNMKMKNLAGKLKNNYVIRATQAEALAQLIDDSPYPVIVCGDFNDTPLSYTYRKIHKGMKDSFREAGYGYGYTYRGFFNLLRIDYVMHSKQLECVEYLSPSFDCSDHNPILVRIKHR